MLLEEASTPCSSGKNGHFDHAACMSGSLHKQYTYFESLFSLKKTEQMTKSGGKSPVRCLSPQCSCNLSAETQLHYLKWYAVLTNTMPYVVSLGCITNLNNNHFQWQVKIAPTINVLINKWANNGELIVTGVQCERLGLIASIVTINFHVVAKYNLGDAPSN